MLKDLAFRRGVASRVEFPGLVTGEEKARIWENAELFILPSRWEGLPLSILEALGHGVPCVVTPETGMGEWLEENRCGWSVRGDASGVAEILIKLANCRDEISEMAKNTLSSVERDFSWKAIGERLLAAYQKSCNL